MVHSCNKILSHPPLLPQNANPNQGTYMGTETAPLPEQCATTAKTSEWERAGYKTGGPGACSFSPFLGRNGDPCRVGGPPGAPRGTRKAPATRRVRSTPPPGTGREPRGRSGPAPVPKGPPADSRGPPKVLPHAPEGPSRCPPPAPGNPGCRGTASCPPMLWTWV